MRGTFIAAVLVPNVLSSTRHRTNKRATYWDRDAPRIDAAAYRSAGAKTRVKSSRHHDSMIECLLDGFGLDHLTHPS